MRDMPGLILQRKIGEKIVIGGNIYVSISKVEVASNRDPRVWLAVEAPKGVIVDREEIHEARKRNNA